MNFFEMQQRPRMEHVWVLLNHGWTADEDQHYQETSLIGVFDSPEAALYWYGEEVVSHTKAAQIEWIPSEHNPGYRQGWDPLLDRPVLQLIRVAVRSHPGVSCQWCQAPIGADLTLIRLSKPLPQPHGFRHGVKATLARLRANSQCGIAA
jgi:hypothetical protein